MKQTAVEWLEEQWLKLDLEFTGLIDTKEYDKRRNFIIEQAKAMEKEQIVDAYDSASSMICLQCSDFKIGEQYYNETFKSE